jgi:hypothetical protein
MSTSSAIPSRLQAYANGTTQMSADMLRLARGDLRDKLQAVRSASPGVHLPELDGRMERLAQSSEHLAAWVGKVGGAFERAGRGEGLPPTRLATVDDGSILKAAGAAPGALAGLAVFRKDVKAAWPVMAGKHAWSLFTNTKLYATWVKNTIGAVREVPALYRDPFDAAAMVRFMLRNKAAEQAMEDFKFGKSGAGIIGTVLSKVGASDGALAKVASFKGVLGKVALPLTVVTGVIDVFTGGGYHGGRGVATRVLGGVGALGAGALLASSMGLIALGPVGLAIAGVAVLAYAAWSLGNVIWDHRQAIAHAATVAWDATVSAVSAGAHAVDDAAHAVGRAASNVAHTVTSVISAPLKLIPHISVF